MDSHSATTPITAKSGRFSWKNRMLQPMLRLALSANSPMIQLR
jgi:hypothetical protein